MRGTKVYAAIIIAPNDPFASRDEMNLHDIWVTRSFSNGSWSEWTVVQLLIYPEGLDRLRSYMLC